MEKELASKRMLGVHLLPDIRQGMPCFTLATCTYDRSPKSLHMHIQSNFFACTYDDPALGLSKSTYALLCRPSCCPPSASVSLRRNWYVPVVPHKAVAEVSKIETYRRGWLLWITDGRANPPSFSPFLYLYDYLPTYLRILSLSLSLSHLSISLSVYLSIYLSNLIKSNLI